MITRPGMSCTDNALTDTGMHGACANDDGVDPYSAADLMGTSLWALYCERWQPMRWAVAPQQRGGIQRRSGT
jgi:hypothetical protein